MTLPVSYLTVDAILIAPKNEVLLIRRKNPPFQNHWALPGGFVDEGEDTRAAVARELREETSISGIRLNEFGTYSKPGRDPRGRTVSVVYIARLPHKPNGIAGDDAGECRWFSLNDLPKMSFDHAEILSDVKRRMIEDRFSEFLNQWNTNLSTVQMKSLIQEIPADKTAIVSVDVVNGFCKKGNLASPRVGEIVTPIVQLFRVAEKFGITRYVLLEDHHPPNSQEFQIYPPHCITGTEEAQTVPELMELPQANRYRIIPKKTINPGLDPQFQEWLKHNEEVRQWIVVGDCTDICVYLLSLYLKCYFIQKDLPSRILVPADCVDTFDLPEGQMVDPHPAEFLHPIFLYHMHLNGIQVVKKIE